MGDATFSKAAVPWKIERASARGLSPGIEALMRHFARFLPAGCWRTNKPRFIPCSYFSDHRLLDPRRRVRQRPGLAGRRGTDDLPTDLQDRETSRAGRIWLVSECIIGGFPIQLDLTDGGSFDELWLATLTVRSPVFKEFSRWEVLGVSQRLL